MKTMRVMKTLYPPSYSISVKTGFLSTSKLPGSGVSPLHPTRAIMAAQISQTTTCLPLAISSSPTSFAACA